MQVGDGDRWMDSRHLGRKININLVMNSLRWGALIEYIRFEGVRGRLEFYVQIF